MIELGYAPTVRSSPVPMYMQGARLPHEGLGQDDFYSGADAAPIVPEQTMDLTPAPDFGSPSFSSSPGIFPATDPVLQPLIDSGLSHDAASLLADAASSGAISNAQFQQALNSRMSSTAIENLILGAGNFARVAAAPTAKQIATAAANATKATLGPGASPRVNTAPVPSWTSQKTAIAGMVIPNVTLLGVGAFLLIAMTRKG